MMFGATAVKISGLVRWLFEEPCGGNEAWIGTG